MQQPDGNNNPFPGAQAAGMPPNAAAVFVAFGWFRDFYNAYCPQFSGDMDYYQSLNNGVFV